MSFSATADLGGGPALENLVLRSRWEPTGAGRSDARISGGDLGAADAQASQCWDTLFREVYYTDNVELPSDRRRPDAVRVLQRRPALRSATCGNTARIWQRCPKTRRTCSITSFQRGSSSSPTRRASCNSIYCFKVTGDGGGEWTVDTTTDPPTCTRGDAGKAQCTIEVAHEDFKTMLSDPNAGMQLYFQGKLRVSGDPMLAMKLQQLFEIARPAK